MRISFRPMPGLTLFTLIGLGILIALGTWQYKRLQWKTVLLAEVEAAAESAPFASLSDIQRALEAGTPIDFQRVGLAGDLTDMEAPFFVFTPANRDISWRPFRLIDDRGVKAFVALGPVTDDEKDEFDALGKNDVSLAGYVRVARPDQPPKTPSSPNRNRWFGFNPMPASHDWAALSGQDVDMRFYVDVVDGVVDAFALPPKQPDIRNNHFDYMLTWYALAVLLVIFYVLIHRREGRLLWS